MKIHYLFVLLGSALMAGGCASNHSSGNTLYGQMDNQREFGTIVSVQQGTDISTLGAGTAAENTARTGAASIAGNVATTAASGTLLSPLTAPFSSLTQLFGSNTHGTTDTGVDSVTNLHYVIQKDDGTRVNITQIPEANEPVIYPGQRAMIQMNGDYLRVYPADVEGRRNQ